MTLRMGDGPVANLPAGLDAYAGYVNDSGIGETYNEVVAKFPNAHHLAITTNGSPAQVADVEKGAMTSWQGYTYGYCAVSNVNQYVKLFGRPDKLWTAHYDPKYGAHICSPACWPGLITSADGTQWTDHGGPWDESLLADDFFGNIAPAPSNTATEREGNMLAKNENGEGYWGARSNGNVYTFDGAPYLGPAARFLAQWGIGTIANPVTGIASDGNGGFALLADNGGPQPQIYNIPSDARYAK